MDQIGPSNEREPKDDRDAVPVEAVPVDAVPVEVVGPSSTAPGPAIQEVRRAEPPNPRRRRVKWGLALGLSVLWVLIYGQGFVSWMYLRRAEAKYRAGDKPAAMIDLEQALAWQPHSPELHARKVEFHLVMGDKKAARQAVEEMVAALPDSPLILLVHARLLAAEGDLKGAEADLDRAIALKPKDPSEFHHLRSQVLQRQSFRDPSVDRHAEAVADLLEVQRLSPQDEPLPYNNVAYARALGKRDLQQGLQEAEKAVELLERLAPREEVVKPDASLDAKQSWASILDTRGYLHHLLGDQKSALADLTAAVALAEESKAFTLKSVSGNLAIRNQAAKQFDEGLAVMYQHRGLVYQSLEMALEAQADLDLSQRLGYDPPAGIF